MLLADPDVHRALAYLAALAAEGYEPTIEEFNAYAEQPDRSPAQHRDVLATFAIQMMRALRTVQVAPAESYAAHVVRMRWAEATGDRLRLTGLGSAVFRALEAQSLDPESVLDIVLEKGDPIALARVVSKIAELGPSLLVEPYFRLDVLMPVFQNTQVTRVLTSERAGTKDLENLSLGLSKLVSDRPFEVRAAGREIHDRYIIPDAGPAHFLGASLNGLGQIVTAMGHLRDLSDPLRATYDSIWKDSRVIGTVKSASDEPPVTAKPTTTVKKPASRSRAAKKKPTPESKSEN